MRNKEETGVCLSLRSVGQLLHQQGLNTQPPMRPAYHQYPQGGAAVELSGKSRFGLQIIQPQGRNESLGDLSKWTAAKFPHAPCRHFLTEKIRPAA
jgi:hypothetical protein